MKKAEIERCVSIEMAIKKAEECFKFLKLKYKINKICSINKLISTYSVMIENTDIQGNGKGSGEQSKASALFEALEHYIYYNNSKCDEYMKAEDFKHQSGLLKMESSISLLLDKCKNEDILEVTKFQNFERDKSIYYPTPLWNVYNNSFEGKFDEIKKYSTNSGCAIGITVTEAILHAVNELLERDSLSWHYLDVFIKQDKKAKRVKTESLPKGLQSIYWEVKNSIKENVEIIKIDTINGLYCYLVFAPNKKTGIPYKGSGLSILSEYALERALLECLQSFHLSCEETEIEDKISFEILKKYEKYLKILTLDYKNNFIDINFEENIIDFKDVNQILKCEREILHKHEMEFYYKVLVSINDVYCVQVIIPGIEKFYLVGNGLPVIPGNGRMRL